MRSFTVLETVVLRKLDNNGTLTISGTGEMKSIYSAELPPWQTAYRNMITRMVIEDGVTTIGDIAFSDCNALTTVELPASLKKIGMSAFADCSALEHIRPPRALNFIEDYAFSGCTSLTQINLPITVTEAAGNAFADSGIRDIWYEGTHNNLIFHGNATSTIYRVGQWHYEIIDNDTCGSGLSWGISRNGELTISGSGAMADYAALEASSTAPW